MCRARKSVKKMKAKKGKSVTCSIFFLKAAPPFFFPSPFPRPSNTADMKFNLPYIFLLLLAVTKDIKTASADNLRTLEAEEPTLTHPSDGLTIISTGAEPSTTTDVLERRINELEAQLTELAQQVVGAPAGLADLADNVVGVSSRGLKKGKGKGKGKSCYDRDGELKLNWIGVYGDKYSNGLVTLNQNGEPMGLPSFKIGPFGNDGPYPTVSITEGPPGTNSYESTYGNPLNPVHKPLMQEFNGLLTG